MNWPARIHEARAAVDAAAGDKSQAARALSSAWGCRVSVDSLTSALRRWADLPQGYAPQPIPRVDDSVLSKPTTPPESSTSKLSQICILSDLHIPEHDDAALDCAMAWISAEQPATIVLNGDVGEWESCSQHGTSPAAPMFRADLEAVGGFLRRLRKAAPNAKCYWLCGNHETRLSRMICTQAPTLYGALSIPALLELDRLGVQWVPEKEQPLRLGSLYIIHGHQKFGQGCVHMAAKAAGEWCAPGKVVAVGHSHRRQMFRRPTVDGDVEGVLVPCLCHPSPNWQHVVANGWSHGFAVATQRAGHRTALEVIDIESGSCCWGGRIYRGQRVTSS